ncbi:phycobilisome protein [Pseudanabaena sp. SR411]|uniref:phycobilisome protein n=1 Tax=Pseudanabaena sp. SR411 TaxID=1980935 RepID=UPI000B998DE4|nr:phycobilisome protein [Pseudanabaena sp. SR411]OYQ62933.1 phycobilisome protein [Pseudanabaena sp. SR411]
MSNPKLSEKVRELIQKSRIVSFTSWQSIYPDLAIAKFQAADDQGRYLTDQDLDDLQRLTPAIAAYIPIVKLLTEQAASIVDEARTQVLTNFPDITQEGGGLYPAERANACWRDFWHFLRCITYGITGQRLDYLSAEGLGYMQQLYQELQVPLDAMILGLTSIKIASLNRLEPDQQTLLAPYFDCLIEELKLF